MKRFLAAVPVLIVAVLAAAAHGGEETDGKGPLQSKEVRTKLRCLLVLGLGDAGLSLDRESYESGGKSAAQVAMEMEQQYLQQGIPPEQAARMAEQMARFRSGTGLRGVFSKLAGACGANRRSSSMGGENSSSSFSGGSVEGKYTLRKEALEIELVEKRETERKLTLKDDGKGLLEISLAGEKDGTLLKLSQSPKGGFKAEWQPAGEARKLSVSGGSFAEAYAANREVIEGRLMPFLRALGVEPPATPMSPAVVNAVIDELRTPSKRDRDAAAALLKQLDSEDFQERDNASRELDRNYSRFRRMIAKHLERKDISAEARGRLEQIVENHPARARLMRTLTLFSLLDDVDYLTALQRKVGTVGRELIAKRLAELKK
ncbi:MAG: hypothetical protein ACYTGB_08045 [Planctomycetota bacterium]|jgi:hypothetical protein